MSHRCIAETACRAAEVASDGTREGAVTTEPDVLCEPCLTHISSAVAQLPKDWEELRNALGERTPGGRAKVRSTPSPAIPISAAKEALMTEIVELADRAAAAVSDQLRADQPTGRRNTAPTMIVDGREVKPKPDTPAANAETTAKADPLQALRASVAMIEPHIDKLAAAPVEAVVLWDKDGEDTGQPLERDADGEPVRGYGRIFTDQSGLDLALDLVDVHNRVRAELGKTRLRHKFGPCPRCGHPCGRDDGSTIVDCKNEACKGAWTEREFHYLQGLILEEREKEILRYLLTEAYWELDRIQNLVDTMVDDDVINQAGAGTIIIDELKTRLSGHLTPEQREIATDKTAAQAREVEDWQWSWTNESTYRPPKRKPQKPKKEPDVRYTASSLSTLVDVDDAHLTELVHGHQKCRECNEVHAGECA